MSHPFVRHLVIRSICVGGVISLSGTGVNPFNLFNLFKLVFRVDIPNFTPKMAEMVHSALSTLAPNAPAAELARHQCTADDLSKLNGLNWLNDEVRSVLKDFSKIMLIAVQGHQLLLPADCSEVRAGLQFTARLRFQHVSLPATSGNGSRRG